MVDSYSIFTYICSERQDRTLEEDTCCLERRRSSGIGQLLNMIIFNFPELWQLPHVATRGPARAPAAVSPHVPRLQCPGERCDTEMLAASLHCWHLPYTN